jgi:hypothetical protein
LNHSGGTPITSLHYFSHLFEEAQQAGISREYRQYIAAKVQKLEQQWT